MSVMHRLSLSEPVVHETSVPPERASFDGTTRSSRVSQMILMQQEPASES